MKLNKNLLGNIVIIISILLVILCLAMIMISGPMGIKEVEWEGDGYNYMLSSDMEYSMDENTFNITSPYDANNYEMKKTDDLSNFNEHLKVSSNSYSTERNLTHTLIVNEKDNYAAIVPTDSFKPTKTGFKLTGNPEIIEIKTKNVEGLMSFILSSHR
jgi:flagellar basal body-associated protein FliL